MARLEFIYTPLFEASISGLLDDEVMRGIEVALLRDPMDGPLVPGTGGVRKTRVALPGRGKRGGARLLYLFDGSHGRIYFLLAYAKNRKLDLTQAEKRALKSMTRKLARED